MGIDIAPTHIEIENQSVKSQPFKNTVFSLCDATKFDNVPLLKYDIIFSVEALCHLDTATKQYQFLSHEARNLSSQGRIVIIDGLRSADFDHAPENQKIAMKLLRQAPYPPGTSRAYWQVQWDHHRRYVCDASLCARV